MLNEQTENRIREEYEKNHPCLGEKDVDPIFRYCRLDYPDGDNRSIKSFIDELLKSQKEETTIELNNAWLEDQKKWEARWREELVEKIEKLEVLWLTRKTAGINKSQVINLIKE